MLFRNLTTSLGVETGCQGGQSSPRAVGPSEEEEEKEEEEELFSSNQNSGRWTNF
jgi:hypothetical protein